MLLQVAVSEKSFGVKQLYTNVKFTLESGEKVGLIGRNGIGKSTLFGIIAGEDNDYTGQIILRKGASLVSTAQEYDKVRDLTATEYILAGLPHYASLSRTLREFPLLENPTDKQIERYSAALDEFGERGYYNIQGEVEEELKKFQLDGVMEQPFKSLSGGQKRLSEVIKIMHAKADLALIDEPTNFMDYVAKEQFISWLVTAPEAMLIITHDRDVLQHVDRIIEIKDGMSVSYKGNYDDYIRQNLHGTATAMQDYEQVEKRMKNLQQKVIDYKRLKEKARNPATIHQFKRLEENARAELDELSNKERPSFWIDRESLAQVGYKDADRYAKYQAKNIKVSMKGEKLRSERPLVQAIDLAVGYQAPILEHINFALRSGERLELCGRNGVGKSTLLKVMLGLAGPKIFAGEAHLDRQIRIGIYEQEEGGQYARLTLKAAIEQIYLRRDLPISDTKIRQLLSNYLFTEGDGNMLVDNLSGGQKARLQIIRMLANNPDLIILDEPTSHLDLPSIEELEQALAGYAGAIIYISHDNYFRRKLGGIVLQVGVA